MRLATALVLLILALPSSFAADLTWVGPMPFVKGRTLRPDFLSTILNPAAWPTVLSRTQVFKSYIMILPSDPVPGKTTPEISDADLARLAHFFRARHIKIAFEVGGLRFPAHAVPIHPGAYSARSELHYLRRWLKAGGTIDYLTTDHAVMANVGAYYVDPARKPPPPITFDRAIDALANYFAIVSKAIPGVKLGTIESLGFWEVPAGNGKIYHRTVPALPKWRFDVYLDKLLAAMKQRGLTLDHFDIDFGYEGAHHDGAAYGGGKEFDFGRFLAVERICHSRGVHVGVIVNAFHDRSVKNPDPATASRQAHDRTLAFFRGLRAAGDKADSYVLQSWMPYPDHTGPETSPRACLNIDRDILLDPSYPH